MPYLITTKRLAHYTGQVTKQYHPTTISRRAVATLKEARDAVYHAATFPLHDDDRWAQHVADVMNLPESGGTVGPLPDGTVIEVERVEWADLRERAGLDRDGFTVDRKTIDAYNARETSR